VEQALPTLATLEGVITQVEEFCRMHPGVQPDVALDEAIGDRVLSGQVIGQLANLSARSWRRAKRHR